MTVTSFFKKKGQYGRTSRRLRIGRAESRRPTTPGASTIKEDAPMVENGPSNHRNRSATNHGINSFAPRCLHNQHLQHAVVMKSNVPKYFTWLRQRIAPYHFALKQPCWDH